MLPTVTVLLILVILVPYGTFAIEVVLHEPYRPLVILNVTVYLFCAAVLGGTTAD